MQWTVSVERGKYGPLVSYLIVNLEGMKYEKHEGKRLASWPVSRLIRREQREPKLFEKIAQARRSNIEYNKIKVCWWRDAWAGAVRPPIQDQDHCILCAYLSELELAQAQWLEALEDALACLDATKNYHGRAKQLVTLKDGPKELEVSPHLQFRWELSSYLQFPLKSGRLTSGLPRSCARAWNGARSNSNHSTSG